VTDTVIYPNAMVILTTNKQHILSLSKNPKIKLDWWFRSCIPFVERIFYNPDNDVHEEAYSESTFGNTSNLHPAHGSKKTSLES